MAIVDLKWAWLGIAIPAFLIAFIGYSSHFFIFRHYFSTTRQVVLQCMISMIWLSYYLAITVQPGSPPKNYKYPENRLVWHKWCKKCSNYKPERCHHCKTCKTCVLKMDHHCPWTMNCVGYENLPHFLRFLVWVLITTGFVLYELGLKIVDIYHLRNLPAYLFSITELVFVVILTLLDSFVLVSIAILILRVISNQFFSGMTQIEIWEHERLDSQIKSKKLWRQINKNYAKVHGRKLNHSRLVSSENAFYQQQESDDTSESYELELRNNSSSSVSEPDLVPDHFSVDDIIFPYDISFWQNVYNCVGPLYLFWWPWAGPPHTSVQNGLVYEIDPDFVHLDQLGLPWPPDDGTSEVLNSDVEYYERASLMSSGRRVRVVDPRLKLARNEWFNDFGERLSDFGVDLEAETDETHEGGESGEGIEERESREEARD